MKSKNSLILAAAVAALFAAPTFAADTYGTHNRANSAEAAQQGAPNGDSGPKGAANGGSGYTGAQVNTTGAAANSAIDAQRRDADGTGQTTGPARGYNAQTPGNSMSRDRDAATRSQKGAAGGDSGQYGNAASTGSGQRGSAQVGSSNSTTRGSTGSSTRSGAYPSGSSTTQNGVTTTVVPDNYRGSSGATNSSIDAQRRDGAPDGTGHTTGPMR